MLDPKKFYLDDTFATLGSHCLCNCMSNIADRAVNESPELKPKLDFVFWSKSLEFYKERNTGNTVNNFY